MPAESGMNVPAMYPPITRSTRWGYLPGLLFCSALILGCGERAPREPVGPVTHEAVAPADPRSRFNTALDSINQLIIRSPDRASLYEARGNLFLGIDSLEAAERDLNRAVRLDSTNVGYRLQLGDLRYRQLDIEGAYKQFERAAELDPSSTAPLLKQAEIQLVLRNYEKSMALVNDALRKDQHAAHGYRLKAWIHMETGDTALALSSFRTAVEHNNEDYSAYIMLAKISAARHDPLAEQYYNTALSIRPRSVEAWYNKGMYYQENGYDSLALDCYDRIKEIDPNNALPWYNTGYLMLERFNDPVGARDQFSEAIRLEPGYTDAWYNKGLAFERMDQLDSAAAYYQACLAIKHDHDLAARGMERMAKRGVRIRLRDR